MNIVDLFTLIGDNLGRRTGRVALTAVGVVIGTAAVIVLVSLGIGLQRNANDQLAGIGDLTIITVEPIYGEIAQGGGGPGGPGGPGPGGPGVRRVIDDQSLAEMALLPGVTAVIPRDGLMPSAVLRVGRLESWAWVQGLGVADLSAMDLRAQAGSTALERGSVILGSHVPSQFYNPSPRPGQPPEPLPDLADKLVRLTLIKWAQDGTEIKKVVQVRVAGILAETGSDVDYSAYMPLADVTVYNEWALGKRINRARDGYPQALVKVVHIDKVLAVADQVKAMDYAAYTLQTSVEGVNNFFIVMQVTFGGVGAIALLVAAIGIANTMAMAILERTREIGLMKAVGASNREVLSIFLGEAAGIGFLGGVGGVAFGWSAGQVINVLALAYMAGNGNGGPPPSIAVYTPLWLPIFTLVFATLIGLLSGLYPALRAATLVPVVALKYE